MRKNYLWYVLILAILSNPFAYATSRNKSLHIKKDSNSSFVVNSLSDPNWSYTCQDGMEVSLVAKGINNSVPAYLDIANIDDIDRLMVEIIYKGDNPGDTIEIYDDTGNAIKAGRTVISTSDKVWVYRTKMPATPKIHYINTDKQEFAQSIVAYISRKKPVNVTSMVSFTELWGGNNIKLETIPLETDTEPRTIEIELPVSGLTADGRYIHIEAYASDGSFTEITDVITSFPDGGNMKTYKLILENVAGSANQLEIMVDTRNNQNGMDVKGQSWTSGGIIKIQTHCTCLGPDTEPPFADNLVDHRLLQNIAEMPKVTFSDTCSSNLTEEYYEYEPVSESCILGAGTLNTESNIWFHSFPFDKYHHWENGYFEKFPDGTTRLHGRVVNNLDTISGWIIDLYFQPLVDYNSWIASGGYTADDDQRTERQYAAIDYNRNNSVKGFGNYSDSFISLPTDTNYHHLDLGPRDAYGTYGLGLWLSYEGFVKGQPVGGETLQYIEGAASLNRCARIRGRFIVREWVVTDEAGNTNIFVQRVELEE